MTINVTEEQKRLIESQGYMVVEFKAWYKKLIDFMWEWGKRVIDTWNAIISFLQEMAFKAFDSLKDLAERYALEFKPYVEQLEDVDYEDYSEKQKYPFVRSIGRMYRPNFSYRVIYHRCRDRC